MENEQMKLMVPKIQRFLCDNEYLGRTSKQPFVNDELYA